MARPDLIFIVIVSLNAQEDSHEPAKSAAEAESNHPDEQHEHPVMQGQLHPDLDTDRITVSGSYHKSRENAHWQTLLAWAQNRNDPGRNLDAFLLESAVRLWEVHTIFARAGDVVKDELFREGEPLEHHEFTVNKLSLGYQYDFPKLHSVRLGIGGVGSANLLPDELRPAYGDSPLSFLVFVQAKL